MKRSIVAMIGVSSSFIASTVLAQSVSTPSSTNLLIAHGVHTAGNAAALAPSAHEILAPVVAGTVPATKPLTQGVTAAGTDVANGTYKTGTNIQTSGLSVTPTGALAPNRRALETATAKALVAQTGVGRHSNCSGSDVVNQRRGGSWCPYSRQRAWPSAFRARNFGSCGSWDHLGDKAVYSRRNGSWKGCVVGHL